MADMRSWTPDVNGYMKHCRPDETLRDLSKRFDMPALMVPCWACLARDVPQDRRGVIEDVTPKLRWRVHDLVEKHGMNPNMRTLFLAET